MKIFVKGHYLEKEEGPSRSLEEEKAIVRDFIDDEYYFNKVIFEDEKNQLDAVISTVKKVFVNLSCESIELSKDDFSMDEEQYLKY